MTESKAEAEKKKESSSGSSDQSMANAMEPCTTPSSEKKYSGSTRGDGAHRPNSHRTYNSSNSSNRRTLTKYVPNPRSRLMGKPNSYAIPFSTKRTKNIYELDGQQKYTFKRGGYFENLRCPPCVLSNLSQTYKHRGIPWWDGVINYRQFSNHYEGLHLELEHFYSTIKPYTEDDVLRKATFYCISKSIKRCKTFDIDAVKYYGSYSSGTYLPVSDIDMVVYCNPNYNIVEILIEIAGLLFTDGIIEKSCSIIPHSRIPLLKFYDSLTGFLINITVNTPHVMDRADYIRDSIKANPYMIKILYFLKYYLIFKGNNQVFYGGIGSYSLALMVIRYFQLKKNQRAYQDF